MPADELKAGVVDLQGAQAVFRQGVSAGVVTGEGTAACGEGPGAEVESFPKNGGEPEVAFPAGGVVFFIFTVSQCMQNLLEKCYLVHGARITGEPGGGG